MKQQLFEWAEQREPLPQKNLSTTCEVNSAYSKITNHIKPEEAGDCSAAKAKVLSPERTFVSKDDAFHLAEGRITGNKRQADKNLTESEATAQYRKDYQETQRVFC